MKLHNSTPRGQRAHLRCSPLTLVPLLSAVLFGGCGSTERQQAQPAAHQAQTDRRIISQLPSTTEICYAMGLGPDLVAVTDYCLFPPEAQDKPSIGGIMSPNLEVVMSLKPDLILIQDTQTELINKYKELGLDTLVVRAHRVSHVFDAVELIGRATERPQAAAELNRRLEAELARVRAAAEGRPRQKTLLVIGHEPGALREIYTAGPGTFLGELLETAGGENCVPDSSIAYPKISKEEILRQSPEVIIVIRAEERVVSGQEHEVMRKREAALWAELSFIEAVKTDRIYLLTGDYYFIPGPRIASIAEDFQRCFSSAAELKP